MVGQKALLLASALVLAAVLAFAFLYLAGGLRQYWRAVFLINELPPENKAQARRLLYGNTSGNEYGGIYAGVTKVVKPMVWVWGERGLKPFVTDEFSVFWRFDGCSKPLDPSDPRIPRKNDRTIDDWRGKMKAGDYVMVVVTAEKMGGTKGNLREAAGMNWWGFLQKGLEAECQK